MVGSDGRIRNGQGHPRSAGTFPRVLGRYVREEGYLTLINALQKMTVMPAERLGLKTKGRIQEGFDADITVFNDTTVLDGATYEAPTQPPSGIEYVLVNGSPVAEKGRLTGLRPGVFLHY